MYIPSTYNSIVAGAALHALRAYSRLVDRLGRPETVIGDVPCTLQVPPPSRRILMLKLIVVGLLLQGITR
jgi:hypothetical protein